VVAASSVKTGGIILCGGRSRRMGTSKAWLRCGREYLLQRVVRIVAEVADPVVVAARSDQELPPLPEGVAVVHDAVANCGPLAGIAAGFDALAGRCDVAFVTPSDHPLLEPAFISRLTQLLGEHRAVVPTRGKQWYPLTAVYRLDTRVILEDMLARGELPAHRFAERCAPHLATESELLAADPHLDSLLNVNDPEDYQRVMKALEE
jgi:molybdopterin-guanine dinucleotide biosynthesis protein A